MGFLTSEGQVPKLVSTFAAIRFRLPGQVVGEALLIRQRLFQTRGEDILMTRLEMRTLVRRHQRQQRRNISHDPRRRVRLWMELLEDRVVPSVIEDFSAGLGA